MGAYILAVTLAAPAMLRLGIDPLVTHFSVFYWSMLSAITPPVAAVCVAGAGIAGSRFLPTCIEALKLGFPIFFLPILFLTEPRILDFSLSGIEPALVCLIGFAAFAAFLQSDFKIGHRLALFCLFILIFFSKYSTWTIFAGNTCKRVFVLITLGYLIYLLKKAAQKRKAKLKPKVEEALALTQEV